MSSLFDRFNGRDNPAMVITVPFPWDNPIFELTVNRIPWPMLNAAVRAGITMTNELKIPIDSPKYDFNKWMWGCYALVPHIQNHTTGWKSLVEGKEMEPFTPKTLTEAIGRMSDDELKMLGYSYEKAVEKVDGGEKKSSDETNTAKDS
jgi:hypothetical protein